MGEKNVTKKIKRVVRNEFAEKRNFINQVQNVRFCFTPNIVVFSTLSQLLYESIIHEIRVISIIDNYRVFYQMQYVPLGQPMSLLGLFDRN